LRIGIVAGEASGDYLGASLLKSLRESEPQLQAEGIGGPLLREAGCRILYPMEVLSVMGLVEVLGSYQKITAVRRALLRHFARTPPDVFIGVDAPDFNLDLELRLHKAGIKTVHYVSPQVWAWREYRLRKIARAVDLMLTLFPFEETYYHEHGLPAVCVGHPLANQIPMQPDPAGARTRLGLHADQTIVALMPGSRSMEIQRLARPFLLAARECLIQRQGIHYISNLLDAEAVTTVRSLMRESGLNDLPVSFYTGHAHDVLEAADVVLLASGTVALEAMLYKKPMVVAYKVNWLTYLLLKALIKVPYVSLPNLLAQEQLVPERLQGDCTPERLAREVLRMIDDRQAQAALGQKFSVLHQNLQSDTTATASRQILNLVNAV